MVSGEMFNELEVMARRIMGNPAPFGGVQLVLSGDYFQCARGRWSILISAAVTLAPPPIMCLACVPAARIRACTCRITPVLRALQQRKSCGLCGPILMHPSQVLTEIADALTLASGSDLD